MRCTLFVVSLEMMSVVYNYIRVDTPTFLTNASHVDMVIDMSKAVRNEHAHMYMCNCD